MMRLLQTERFQNLSNETEQAIAVHLYMKGLTEKMEKERKEGKREGKKEEKIHIIRKMRSKIINSD